MVQERTPSTGSRDTKYTWDDTIAAVGQDFAAGEKHVADEVVDYSAVSRYCEVWEIGNPIYWHSDAAKQAGYRDVVVPWSAVKQTFAIAGGWKPGEPTRFPLTMDKDATARLGGQAPSGKPIPKPPTAQGLVTDVQIEFFEPVCVGDNLTVKGNKLVTVRVRETRIGYGAFMNRESEVFNQHGQLVARVNGGGYSYNAGEKAPK